MNGHAYGIDLKLEKPSYLAQAAATDGFIAFRLREEGGSHLEPESPLAGEGGGTPTTPATRRTRRHRLHSSQGRKSRATTNGHGIKKNSEEAFFRASQDKTMRNVLDGVSTPELGQEWANEKYIRDRMTMSLVTGFGKQAPIVLCVFIHQRGDYGNPPSKFLLPFQVPLQMIFMEDDPQE